jgi:triphosphoribosyl-dephospho-CoA synthase
MVAQTACILEVTARKLGNVHRFADYEDATYLDFVLSAAAIRPAMERASEIGVGAAVLEAVRATREVVSTNTNLGLILLLAPIAAIPKDVPTREGLETVLNQLTIDDSRLMFQAIRLANPAGLGTADQQDVKEEPTQPLRHIMALSAERDLVARQYANGYREARHALEVIRSETHQGRGLEDAILSAQLVLLRCNLDTLVTRKLGISHAEDVRERVGTTMDDRGRHGIDALDDWLRADRHARNPGATADVIGAGIAWALRDGLVRLPLPQTAFGRAIAGQPMPRVSDTFWEESGQ